MNIRHWQNLVKNTIPVAMLHPRKIRMPCLVHVHRFETFQQGLATGLIRLPLFSRYEYHGDVENIKYMQSPLSTVSRSLLQVGDMV